MSNRTYTITFDDEYMEMGSTDDCFEDDQVANILFRFAIEIKPHAPLVALSELYEMVRKELLNQRGKENNN